MDGPRHRGCLHELIDSVAATEPDAIAIEFNTDTVTYQDLNTRAGRLAAHLRTMGAGPDVLVGVCVERSIDLIITLLAVLKAGAAYIPLDPRYPTDRICTILSDSGAAILIATSAEDCPDPGPDCRKIFLGTIPPTDGTYSCPNVRPENLAYVIYTSGSTGKPKGVKISHSAAVNFLLSMQRDPGLTKNDVVLAATTVSFDISVLEIFLPLITGARVRLIDQTTARDGQLLMQRMNGTSVMQATPATWRMLLAAGWEGHPGLKVLCGGEAMTRELAVALRSRSAAVWNMYGPTETTVWSSMYRVPDHLDQEVTTVPIGQPIAATCLYVMDDELKPVAAGDAGELLIGGAGLAQGYLNRPDLTAEKFVDTEFGRLYRTGDLARLREDGHFEYLGRTDHQVKVRGFRIELGEIEAVLMNHGRVHAAAVLAVEDSLGDKRLEAYIVRQSDVTARELRDHLQRVLPEYMIPGTFLFLDAMPLTPNGKIDRKALAAGPIAVEEPETAYTAPHTPTEERLAGLWQEVLGRPKIGIHDNFLELGGHSLTATRILSRIIDEFQTVMSFQDFFDAPTVAEQATIIDGLCESPVTAPPVIRPRQQNLTYPLSFAQQRLWYIDKLEGTDTSYNMVEALRLTGPLNPNVLRAAVDRLVLRHEILRTSFEEKDGVPYQIIHDHRPAGWREVDLRDLDCDAQTAAIKKTATDEAYYHFNLKQDGLMRTILIRTATDEYVLMTNMQHIVSDDWSMGIYYEELSAVYSAMIRGDEPVLPPLSLQYADYACWQRQWLTESIVEQRMEYWRRQLKNVPLTLDLSPDGSRRGPRRASGGSLRLTIDAEMTQRLHAFSVEQGVTLFMTLWAAFAMLIARRARQEDVVIATTMANRHHPEIENVFGFFINVLPLRVQLHGDPDLKAILSQVRKVALEAFHEQDMPLDKIIEKLQLSRGDLDALPLSSVAFNFQNIPQKDLCIGDLKAEPVPLDIDVVGTDLALLISDVNNHLEAVFEYSSDLFRRETIGDVAKQYNDILRGMLELKQPSLTALYIGAGLAPVRDSGDNRDQYFNSYLGRTNLTGNQLLVWLGQQINPADPIYNSVITYTLREAIDPDHFRAAFQKVVDCRDSLRTRIRVENGVPRQVVDSDVAADVIYVDFSDRPDPDAAVRDWIARRVQTAFALDGRLFSCALLKAADDKYTWCIAQHHIITDGWSQSLIYHDMHQFYGELISACPVDSPQRVAYQDYVKAERELRGSGRYARAAAYWKEQMDDAPEPLRFYGQRARKESSRVQRRSFTLGTQLTKDVMSAARSANPAAKSLEAAKFNVFLTLFALFIAHISGQTDFTVGIPLHNRRSKAFKGVTGLIMQVVPVRVTLERDDTLQTLMRRISRTVVKAMQHGQYVLRNPDQKPLYDVVLNYHMWDGPNFHKRPVEVEWVHPGHAQESLSLQVHDFERGMQGKEGDIHIDLDFHADVFDAAMQTTALDQFRHVVRQYVSDTQMPLSELSLLTETEHALLADGVNATDRDDPEECLQALIERQALLRPGTVAVEDGATQMTYTQLDNRANRLAHHLQRHGVRPEQPVGILIDRSSDMIVSLLAVLKAGGCYLPLDPKSPPERLRRIITDALPGQGRLLVVTRSGFSHQLPDGLTRMICLDDPKEGWESLPGSAPDCGATPDNLAYMIYTSGSTGTPKGVMIEHRSIVNYVRHSVDQYRLSEKDKILQFSSITFDAAAEEIYPVLAAGGTLVLRDEETIRTPQAFIDKCNRHGVTLLSMPTAYFHQLTAAASAEGPKFGNQLRMVLFGGERVFPQEIRRWQQVYPQQPVLVNTYGPTEATVVATTYFLPAAGDHEAPVTEVPIGRPVRNTRVYVLNQSGQPVGVGVPGELAIGGAGVARGYVNRPELTADRFVPEPLYHAGSKVYRTGDMVRLNADGQLEYMGRTDNQVKVRGYRIELEEIEGVLKDLPGIGECAVLARNGNGNQHSLHAYFTWKGQAEEIPDPRSFLKNRLPEYMIPAQYFRVDAFPVTPQGKINRRALPDLAAENVSAKREYAAPTTSIEEQLVQIWADVMKLDKVGVTDDFFELGGHSLLATQIISRVQQAFHIELSLRSLFQEPTIRALAAVIEQEKSRGPAAPVIKRISRDKYRVGVNAQGDFVEVKP